MSITLVQSGIGLTSSYATGLTVTEGNLLVVSHAGFGDGTSSISDNLGTSYTLAGSADNTTGYGGRPSAVFMWYGIVTTTGELTITQTGTFGFQSGNAMNGGGQMCVAEFAGIDPTTPVSQPSSSSTGASYNLTSVADSLFVIAGAQVYYNLGSIVGTGGTVGIRIYDIVSALGMSAQPIFGFASSNGAPFASAALQILPHILPPPVKEQYINNYPVVLIDPCNTDDSTITVSEAASIASGFRILVESELMFVTDGGTTTTWTVTREIESTTAATHAIGTTLYVVLTAGGLTNILAAQLQDAPPATPDPMNDEFNGSVLNNSLWSIYDPSSILGANGTITQNQSWLTIAVTSSTIQQRIFGIYQPAPSSGSWTVRCKPVFDCATWVYFAFGLSVRNSANDKNVWGGAMYHTNYGTPTAYIQRTTGGTFGSEQDLYNVQHGQMYYQVSYDGLGTLVFSTSQSGAYYCPMFTESISSWLGAAPTHVGLIIHPWGDSSGNPKIGMAASWDWFRRIA